jgi:fatty acid desaturase
MSPPNTTPRRSIGWHRTAVPRQAMQALNKRSDFKGLLQIGAHIALIIATGTLAWQVQDQLYLLLPVLFVYGTFYIFILNATHEMCHNTVFKSRWLNAFFLRLFCFFGWRSHIYFWTSHAEHHKYTLHQPDDLEVVLPRLFTWKDFVRTGFIDPQGLWSTLRTTLRHSLGRMEGEWEHHLFPPTEKTKRRHLSNWARFLVLGHASIIGISAYYGLWLLPILTTFGVFYGGLLRSLCNNTQHTGLRDDVPDFRQCTRTVILNPFFRFLYWHMNYHIEHHMYAAVPCYNLGKLHRLIRHESPDPPRGLWTAWKEIFAILDKQRQDPNYQYVPPMPAPHIA